MSILGVPFKKDIDVSKLASIFYTDGDGGVHRRGNRSEGLKLLVDATNYFLARCPRPIFQDCWPLGDASASAKTWFMVWKYRHSIPNTQRQCVHLIATKPVGAITANCHVEAFYIAGSITAANSPIHNENVATQNSFWDVFEDYVILNIGQPINADTTGVMATVGEYTILATTIFDFPKDQLDTAIDTYCNPYFVGHGKEILDDVLENVRCLSHHMRSENLPTVISWSAQGFGQKPNAPGNVECITVDSANYVNLFDQSVFDRTAASPGWSVDMQYAGIGCENESYGKKIAVRPRVWAEADDQDANVKFIGPEHVPGNEVTIFINSAEGAGYFEGAPGSEYVFLNPTVNWADDSLNVNKIDVQGQVTSGGTLYVYNLIGGVEYVF
jgi:hypothetical protein